MDKLRFTIFGFVAIACFPSMAAAQHADIMVQDFDDRLTHGLADYTNDEWTLGNRTYVDDFDSDFQINNPGWTILGSENPDMPPGAEALVPNTNLEFDFLPMKIDGFTSNFMYWDGNDDVAFGPTPGESYVFGYQSFDTGFVIIDGSPVLQEGAGVHNADNLGSFHQHYDWAMDDDLSVSGLDVADGIYLVAMRNRMEGLDRSRPYYVIFGTPGSSTAARDAAEAWVDLHADEISPDFSADFDGDLDVDSDDFSIWQSGYGTHDAAALQIVGDADFDAAVGGLDLLEWQRQFGSNLSTFAGTTPSLAAIVAQVPEPTSLALLGLAGLALSTLRGARRIG